MAENHIDILKNLIEVCRDGQNGYLHAAGHVNDPELKSYFNEQSLERGRFAVELQDEVEKLGAPAPETSGSVAAVLHRAWFELKADLGGGDQSVINSVEQGEDRAKQVYEEAMRASLPSEVLNIISRQYASVRAAHDRVRDIRDAGGEARAA